MNALAGFFAIRTPTKTPIAMMIRASIGPAPKHHANIYGGLLQQTLIWRKKGIDN
jgi:hypothetical protein